MRRLRGVRDLPSLPDIIRQLHALLENPTASAGQVASLLEAEPVLAGKVLHLANSAFYGAGRKTLSDISLAVNRLGFESILGLVYSAVLPQLFGGSKGMDHLQFWRHSITVALLSREYLLHREENDMNTVEQAYVAGLMHDIGILVFLRGLGDHYRRMVSEHFDTGMELATIEDEAYAITHAEVGANFIEHDWKLDRAVVRAVAHHHDSFEEVPRPDPVALAVHIANTVCTVYGISNGLLADARHQHMGMLMRLGVHGLEQEEMETMLEKAKNGMAAVDSMITN
jgi:HD-like signal output (HDOD) protein